MRFCLSPRLITGVDLRDSRGIRGIDEGDSYDTYLEISVEKAGNSIGILQGDSEDLVCDHLPGYLSHVEHQVEWHLPM